MTASRRLRLALLFFMLCSALYFVMQVAPLWRKCLGVPSSVKVTTTASGVNFRHTPEPLQESHEYTPSPVQQRKLRILHENLNLTSEKKTSRLPVTVRPKYTFNNAMLCSGGVDILFVVNTATENFQKRNTLRRTIANRTFYKPLQVRILFLLGRSNSNEKKNNATHLQKRLELEHAVYKDTVQGDFLDTYHNLSLKGVMGFHWVTHFCPHARLVLKLDDDVFVDVFKLRVPFFSLFANKKRVMFCNVKFNRSETIWRGGKWMVENSVFHGQTKYPYAYCLGMGLVISGDLIPELYKAAHFTPLFWIDDLYLFGILPAMVGNITMHHIGSHMTLNASETINCVKKQGIQCDMLMTLTNPQQFSTLWEYSYKTLSGVTKAYRTVQLK